MFIVWQIVLTSGNVDDTSYDDGHESQQLGSGEQSLDPHGPPDTSTVHCR